MIIYCILIAISEENNTCWNLNYEPSRKLHDIYITYRNFNNIISFVIVIYYVFVWFFRIFEIQTFYSLLFRYFLQLVQFQRWQGFIVHPPLSSEFKLHFGGNFLIISRHQLLLCENSSKQCRHYFIPVGAAKFSFPHCVCT